MSNCSHTYFNTINGGTMKKNKIFIIALCISIVAFIVIYIKTDIFKTKEQLFWKYMWIETKDVTEILSNETIKKYDEEFNNSKYIKEGNIIFTSRYNIIKPISINIIEKGDNQKNIINTKVDIEYNNTKIADAFVIKDNDYYLLKCEKINEKYIGVENNNLKELAKTLGIENVDFIPDKIEKINYNEVFSISNKEKNHIIGKYVPIFRKHITSKKYTKEENIKLGSYNNITAYKLEITQKDSKELIIDLLNELKEDEIALMLISQKIRAFDESNQYCDIGNIKIEIDNWLKFLNDENFMSEAENEKFLSIIIYKKENEVIKLDFVLQDNRTISLQLNKEENKIILQQHNVNNKEIKVDSTMGILATMLNNVSEINYSRNIEDNKTDNIEMNVILNIGIEKFELKYKSNETINEDIGNIIRKKDVEYVNLKEIIVNKIDLNKFFRDVLGAN